MSPMNGSDWKIRLRRIRVQYREGDIDGREYQQESDLTKTTQDATRVLADNEVVHYGDQIEGLLDAPGGSDAGGATSC